MGLVERISSIVPRVLERLLSGSVFVEAERQPERFADAGDRGKAGVGIAVLEFRYASTVHSSPTRDFLLRPPAARSRDSDLFGHQIERLAWLLKVCHIVMSQRFAFPSVPVPQHVISDTGHYMAKSQQGKRQSPHITTSVQLRESGRERELKRALGLRIQALRDALGVRVAGFEKPLSLADLAAKLSETLAFETPISSSTVARWEKGEGHVAPWVLIELARLARCSVEEFVYPEDTAETQPRPHRSPMPIDPRSIRPAPRSVDAGTKEEGA